MKDIIERIDAAEAALRESVDPERRKAERDEHLADFGPTGKWRFAPADERIKAQMGIQAEQDHRSGERLFALESFLMEQEPIIEATIGTLQEPPDALAAAFARHQIQGMTLADRYAVLTYAEARERNLRDELKGASVRDVLTAYQRAVDTGDDCAIRVIERGTFWKRGSTDDVAAVAELSRLIAKTRAARVPDDVRQVQAAIQRAKRAAQRVKDTQNISPRRPVLA